MVRPDDRRPQWMVFHLEVFRVLGMRNSRRLIHPCRPFKPTIVYILRSFIVVMANHVRHVRSIQAIFQF